MASTNCAVIRRVLSCDLTLPSITYVAHVSLLIVLMFLVVFLYSIEVVREMTRTSFSLERFEMSSSVNPSLKYSWEESLLILTKGKTRIDLLGTRSPFPSRGDASGIWIPGLLIAYNPTSSFTFLRKYFPRETA